METRANYALIGVFTLAVIASAFGFVFWFSGGDSGQRRQPLRVVFEGSVSGLTKGSVVLFNGIRVGEATEISLLPEDPRRVVAVIEVDRSTPVRTDTRARLEYQGLTGVAQVGLSGGEPGAPALVPGPGQSLPTLFADRSDFQDLIESARNIARRADEVLKSVGQVVTDNQGSLNRTVQNVERFSQALGDNAPGVDRFMERVGQAAERIGPLAEKLEILATNVDDLVRSVDRAQVARIMTNVEQGTARIGPLTEKLDSVAANVDALVRAVDQQKIARIVDNVDKGTERVAPLVQKLETLATTANTRVGPLADKLEGLTSDVGLVVRAVDRERIARIVANVDSFSQTLAENRQAVGAALTDASSLVKRLNETAPKIDATLNDISNLAKAVDPAKVDRVLTNADKFAGTLGRSSEDVERAVREARELAEKLNRSADRVDTVLQGAENFLGAGTGGEGPGTFEEIRLAARSIRELAGNLDKRTGELTAGINRFTGAGLREYEALAVEGRKTLNDIGRAVRSLERNPQQVIFGSGGQSGVPQYNGRR
ncbi:MAG TPA: MlaD family protein [Microvirga sp.]|jgi:phospholipid/cholesterol/gamma-HCH transport system substrate-binding protein|nr:MlaD family protein [Microvirga sp.]